MFEPRIRKLKELLVKEELDAVLVSSVSNITYLSGFTNFSEKEREAYIFIGKDFAYIITDGRYSEVIQRQVSHLTLFERGHKKTIVNLFKKHENVKHLGVEENNLTVAEHKAVKKHFKKLKHFEINKLRSIKEKWEIEKIKRSCEVGDLAFQHILGKLRVGVTEKQIAQELEKFIREKGAEFSFPAIVAFGKNSSVPHHQTGDTRLTGKGEFILLDFGVKLENYCSDMTRTVFLGKPSDKQKKIYETVLRAQQKAVDFLNSALRLLRLRSVQVRSGSSTSKSLRASEVDKVARDYIIFKSFLTIPHSLGHGIGLEVHEHPNLSPKSKDILREGMVFSIEPGIYLPDFGGVRIEDLFVLENNGLRQITHSPKQIISVRI